MLSLSAVSLLASCGGKDKEYVTSAHGATIVYDNYESGYIAEKDTQYQLQLAKGVSAQIEVTAHTNKAKYATGYNGNRVDNSRVYEEVDDVSKIAMGQNDGYALFANAVSTKKA